MLIFKKIISNKLCKLTLIIASILIFFGTFSTVDADGSGEIVTPLFQPSGPGRSIPGWIVVSSYKRQPNPAYFATVGDKVTIETSLNKNILSSGFGDLDGAIYHWYQRLPGKNWEKITRDKSFNHVDATQPNYTFSSNVPGTFYFQAGARVLPYGGPMNWFNPKLYSNMTSITFSEKNIPTKDFDIHLDSDYLIVSNGENDSVQSTFAHVSANPTNATDTNEIVWSTKDTDLVSIDAKTGEIFSNNKGNTGIATITGTLKGNREKPIVKSAKIKIGNMLSITPEKPSYLIGDNAEIELHGTYNGAKSVTWYKRKDNNKPQKIPSPENQKMTLNNLTKSDDNTTYYVVVTVDNPLSIIDKTFTSNEITINVGRVVPKIKTTHTISNLSYKNSDDTPLFIKQVEPGDHLMHSITIEDQSDQSTKNTISSCELHLPLDLNEFFNIDSTIIEINGKTLKKSEWENNFDITIENLDIKKKLNINIQTIYGNSSASTITNDEESYTTYLPTLTVHYNNGTDKYDVNLNKTFASFGTEQIKLFATSNIDYGLMPKFLNASKRRIQSEDDENILTIIDNRRIKNPVKLHLRLSEKFHNTKTNAVNPYLDFIYFDSKEREQNIISKDIVIESTKAGKQLKSIKWLANEGVQLLLTGTDFPDGKYTSKLEWYVEEPKKDNQ